MNKNLLSENSRFKLESTFQLHVEFGWAEQVYSGLNQIPNPYISGCLSYERKLCMQPPLLHILTLIATIR